MLLEDILEEYLYDIEVKNYSPRTIKGYKNNNLAFFRFIEADFNITELEKVKAQHIKSYFMYLKKIDRKATYIYGILENIRTLFNYCIDENYITKENNPCLKVGWMKQEKTVIHTFNDAEIGKMIQVFKPSSWMHMRNKMILIFFADLGIQASELIGIEHINILDTNIKIKGS